MDKATAYGSADSGSSDQATLRVCADPNNMPFSNAAGEGFENKLAELLGRALHMKVEYFWWAQRRAFVRNTLNAGKCDVIMGVPEGFGPVATTRAYYASRYVLLYRQDRGYRLHSLADPLLAGLKIGVHLIGSDSTPPALMLAQRGLSKNVVGYSIFGDYRLPNPPATLVDAVANGDIDVAVVWGPLAGYFAAREKVPLELAALDDEPGPLPLGFSIAMGVRKADKALQQELDAALLNNQREIKALLDEFDVPLAGVQAQETRAASCGGTNGLECLSTTVHHVAVAAHGDARAGAEPGLGFAHRGFDGAVARCRNRWHADTEADAGKPGAQPVRGEWRRDCAGQGAVSFDELHRLSCIDGRRGHRPAAFGQDMDLWRRAGTDLPDDPAGSPERHARLRPLADPGIDLEAGRLRAYAESFAGRPGRYGADGQADWKALT